MPRRGGTQAKGRVRIIAGAARGRQLSVTRKERDVRPTPDRVREALFSILGERCVGARVVDLCAGSGALGLEALSRGAESTLFIERDRRVAEVLQENVERVGLTGATVAVRDARKLLQELAGTDARFDLCFLDPPYRQQLVLPIARALVEGHLLAPGARIAVDHPAETLPTIPGLIVTDQRTYGTVTVTLFAEEEAGD